MKKERRAELIALYKKVLVEKVERLGVNHPYTMDISQALDALIAEEMRERVQGYDAGR